MPKKNIETHVGQQNRYIDTKEIQNRFIFILLN